MRNKKILIPTVLAVLIVLLIGAYVMFFNSQTGSSADLSPTPININIENISPEEIGLTMKASPEKQKVQFAIAKMSDIKAISYELTYEADSTEAEKSDGAEDKAMRAVIGESEFKSGSSNYTSPWLDLGSCSRNVCKYDKGVEKVDLLLKITKDNNKVYQAETSLEL